MKRTISFVCICIAILLFAGVTGVFAAAPIDTERSSSLSLQYKYDGEHFEGVEIRTYRIAQILSNGTFELCGEFESYPVSIYSVTSQTEWKNIAETLSAYAAADSIEPDCKGVTDAGGKVTFKDILPGMYLTQSVRIEREGKTVVFESFITAIPGEDVNGSHQYDVVAFPKCTSYTPKPEMLEYKVVKQWREGSEENSRPEFIEVDILKNGTVEFSEKLSSENNWSFSWSAENDGAKWQAVERNVPKGYTVTSVESENTVIITNTYGAEEESAPQTGDTSEVWPYVTAMILAGSVMLLAAIRRKMVKE